jgi:hypothetical protein
MGVSWQDHSVDFYMTKASIAWLQHNISTMRFLSLRITKSFPQGLLQDALRAAR